MINSFIDSLSPHKLLRYVCVYYCFSIFFGYICYGFWGTPKDYLEGMGILSLIGLYLIGAYLRKVKDNHTFVLNFAAVYYLLLYVGLGFVQTAFAFVLLRMGVESSPYGYLNPIILLESVCLFLFFEKLHIRQCGWINYLASSAFAAYLLHCSPALGPYFTMSFKWIETNISPSLPFALVYLVCIYLVAVVIDKAWWALFGLISMRKLFK